MRKLGMWTRFRILNATRALVSEVGVERVTMRGIAKLANITAPAIYKHYRNKRALLDDVIDTGYLELDNEMIRASREAKGGRAGLRDMVDEIVKFSERYPNLMAMMLAPRSKDTRPEDRLAQAIYQWRARGVCDIPRDYGLPRLLWSVLRGDLSRKAEDSSRRDFVGRAFDTVLSRPLMLAAA